MNTVQQIGFFGFYSRSNALLVVVFVVVQFEDLNATRELTVNRAEKRAFSFDNRLSPGGSAWQIVAQTETAYACKIVTLCSTVQVDFLQTVVK